MLEILEIRYILIEEGERYLYNLHKNQIAVTGVEQEVTKRKLTEVHDKAA